MSGAPSVQTFIHLVRTYWQVEIYHDYLFGPLSYLRQSRSHPRKLILAGRLTCPWRDLYLVL